MNGGNTSGQFWKTLTRLPLLTIVRLSSMILFCIPLVVKAQILEHPKGEYFSDDPFFDEEFIARNEIRWIEGAISTKRQMDRVRSKGLGYYYKFDKEGKLKQQYEIFIHNDTVRDTTFINYHYDDRGRLKVKRRNDLHGFYSYAYEYDSQGRVVKETYSRDENLDSSRYRFELGRQIVINTESYSYERIDDTTLQRRVYNSSGLPYKEQTMHYDALGYLKQRTTLFLVNRRRSRVQFEYDKKGRVIERIEDNDLSDTNKRRITFSYDEVGNLLGMEVYENGKHKKHREYLYRDNMLLNAELTKDIETMLIRILKFSYGFYGEEREEENAKEGEAEEKDGEELDEEKGGSADD